MAARPAAPSAVRRRGFAAALSQPEEEQGFDKLSPNGKGVSANA
jgi:hypothetical protein